MGFGVSCSAREYLRHARAGVVSLLRYCLTYQRAVLTEHGCGTYRSLALTDGLSVAHSSPSADDIIAAVSSTRSKGEGRCLHRMLICHAERFTRDETGGGMMMITGGTREQ